MAAPDIVYIDDNNDFADVVERALIKVNQNTTLKTIDNGNTALKTLKQLADDKIMPRLIMLDLNMPGLSGFDILRRMKENKQLKYVPVVIFSTSDNPADVRSSLEFGANAFVTKPVGYLNLIKCLSSIHEFWLSTAMYPA